MRYLRTAIGTAQNQPRATLARVFEKALSKLSANPDYGAGLELVAEWFIEFDDEGFPRREVGIDNAGHAVVAGPDQRNYGFWLDTDMTLKDFTGAALSMEEFEAAWRRFYEQRPGREDPSFTPEA